VGSVSPSTSRSYKCSRLNEYVHSFAQFAAEILVMDQPAHVTNQPAPTAEMTASTYNISLYHRNFSLTVQIYKSKLNRSAVIKQITTLRGSFTRILERSANSSNLITKPRLLMLELQRSSQGGCGGCGSTPDACQGLCTSICQCLLCLCTP
jgi:hypothetical protein